MSSVVTITKSSPVIVRPSSPEPPLTPTSDDVTTTIKLLPLDKGNFPQIVLLLYEHPLDNNAADTVKTALSKALVHYSAFCGRFVSGGGANGGGHGGGSYIDCNGEGDVEFVAASADCPLKQAAAELFQRRPPPSPSSPSSLPEELAAYYPASGYGAGDPMLSVQLTEFACGGFVLGVTWSHAVADGVGIAQFLAAVGELARRGGDSPSPPSVVPVRWDDALASLPPLPNPVLDVLLTSLGAHGHSFGKMLALWTLAVVDLTVPSGFINRVKAEFSRNGGGGYCTTFEVVVAALWQCRTRAIMASPDTVSLLAFDVDVRRYVGAKEGYYGNCSMPMAVRATSGEVVSADIVELVRMVRQAKDQIPDQVNVNLHSKEKEKEKKEEEEEEEESREKKKKGHQLLQVQGTPAAPPAMDGRYDMLAVSSWRSIGFEEVDLGSGPPARVTSHVQGMPPMPSCVITCLRSSSAATEEEEGGGGGGASVFSACVKAEHADAFLAEIAKLK